MTLPNLRHLFAFLEVTRHGSLRQASAVVNLSQPAVSQAIQKLERQSDQKLIERSPRGIFPTEAGQRFAARIERGSDILKKAGAGIERTATAVQLRALIAVVERKSYSAAARSLGITEPSLHRAAREFEQLCGKELFRPSRQGVEPTETARMLARQAALFSAEIAQGLDELREAKGQLDGRISIAALPLMRSHILPTAITGLLAQHPDARISIVDGPYDELLDRLRFGRVDMILGALRFPPPSDDIEQATLFFEPLSVVVRADHPALKKPPGDARELARLDWIAHREGTPARRRFEAFFVDRGVQPPVRIIECSSLITIRSILLQSDRATFLSARQVQLEVETGQLAVLPFQLSDTERPIGIATRAGWRPTALQSAFLSYIHEVTVGF